jgi:hypothetical protein
VSSYYIGTYAQAAASAAPLFITTAGSGNFRVNIPVQFAHLPSGTNPNYICADGSLNLTYSGVPCTASVSVPSFGGTSGIPITLGTGLFMAGSSNQILEFSGASTHTVTYTGVPTGCTISGGVPTGCTSTTLVFVDGILQ